MSENLRACYKVLEHQFAEISRIVKHKRKHSNGKQIALKNQIVLATAKILIKVSVIENATQEKWRKKDLKLPTMTTKEDKTRVKGQLDSDEDVQVLGIEEMKE